MKTLITSSLSLLFSIIVFAQNPIANFYTENGELFYVVLDGRQINDTPANRVSNVPLEHDWAKAKIIFENQSLPELSKTIQGVDVDGNPSNVTWIIKQKKNGKWVINAGAWSALQSEPEVVEQVVVHHEYVNPPPAEVTQTTVTTTTTTLQDPNEISVSGNINGVGININMNVPDIEASYSETYTEHTTTTTTTTNVYQEEVVPPPPPNPLPAYGGPTACHYPMDPGAFMAAKQSIANKDFEDSKLSVAKQVAKANCLLVAQVKEIMLTFDFEDTKLEFAKFAYNYTYDIGNYFMVNDAFTFESSIDELNEYLGL